MAGKNFSENCHIP